MAPVRSVIDSPEVYELARVRVNEIRSAPDDRQALLEAELTALSEACALWENATDIGSEANGPTERSQAIASEAEYKAAKTRKAELLGPSSGHQERTELARVSNALEAWESKHPPSTGTFE